MKHKASAKDRALNTLRYGSLSTAHQLAKIIDVTPQHCNRVLKQLFDEGKVAYTVVDHRGNAAKKRKWCHIKEVSKWGMVYTMDIPMFTQGELPL